jgi:hypothetical protein
MSVESSEGNTPLFSEADEGGWGTVRALVSASVALITFLSMPLVTLIMIGGIVAGIWLVVLRDWHTILLGIAFLFVSTVAFSFVFIPSKLLLVPAAYFAKRGKTIGFVCFGALGGLYSYAVITVWCCAVLWIFVNGATAHALVPLLVWSYGVATIPLAYTALAEYRAGGDSTGSHLATFFAQLAYFIIILLLILSPISLLGVIKVFGGFMLVSFIVQISAAILTRPAEEVPDGVNSRYWESPAESGPAVPPPPSLGVGWLCVLGGLTFGIFWVVWMFVQSFWVRKIDPKSKATLFYTLAVLTWVAAFVIGTVEQNVNTTFQMVLPTGCAILLVVGSFSVKRSLEWYYNTAEPINLHMSSPMVFLFGPIYIQYFLSEIAYWKKTGTFRP